jgi:hypothetical protein
LYFDQDEIAYSLRLFTHGWSVFFPSRVLLYHHYAEGGQGATARPLHWKDCKHWAAYQKLGLARFNHLTEHSLSGDRDVLVDMDKYGLGDARSLDEFEQFTGIDFRTKTVNEHGLNLRFIPGIDQLRRAPVRTVARQSGVPTKPRQLAQEYRFTRVDWRLQPGDVVPYFSLPALQDGKPRELHHFGGRPIVLFFLNNPAHPDLPRFCEAVESLSTELGDDGWCICIIDQQARQQLQGRSMRGVWIDTNAAVADSFGFGPAAEGSSLGGWAVLTANLKLTAVECLRDLGDDLRKVRAVLQVLKRGEGKMIKSGHPPVLLVDDVLPPDCCRMLMDYWSTGNRYEGRVGGRQAYDPGSKIRTDCVLHGAARAEVDHWLARRLLPEVYKVFNIKITRREPYKLGMYAAAKGGFFRPHRDNFEPAMYYRRLAASINLNDGFEGGGVVFPEYSDDTYCPGPGCALVFPCALVHGVKRVASGDRFMIIAFMYSEVEHQLRKERRDPTLNYDDRLLVQW